MICYEIQKILTRKQGRASSSNFLIEFDNWVQTRIELDFQLWVKPNWTQASLLGSKLINKIQGQDQIWKKAATLHDSIHLHPWSKPP